MFIDEEGHPGLFELKSFVITGLRLIWPFMNADTSVTELLRRYNEGDRSAWEQMIPVLYDELRRIAKQRLRYDGAGKTLGATALVNECYLRLLENRRLAAADRNGFLAVASETMRRVMVDYARTKKRLKRGGGLENIPFDEAEHWLSDREAEEVLSIDTALERLKELDERAAKVVELRFFVGLSLDETAAVLGVSSKTIQRTWLFARAWLRSEIGPQEHVQD